jgi:capsular exopolysaccharide synthesis family protein
MDKVIQALDRARGHRAEPQGAGDPGHGDAGYLDRLAPGLRGGDADGPGAPNGAAAAKRREVTSRRHLAANRLIAGLPKHQLADTFAVLRTRVLRQLSDHGFNTLMVASPNPGEGKSTVAANLAIMIAKLSAHEAVLVDADLRRPAVDTLFGVSAAPGLVDYLAGRAPTEACLVDPGIDRLTLMPAGAAVAHSADLLTSARMGELLRELTHGARGRIVVVDGPPVLASDEAIVLARHVDCGLLVVSEGHTPKGDVESAFGLLPGLPFVGTVLNRSRDPVRHYART